MRGVTTMKHIKQLVCCLAAAGLCLLAGCGAEEDVTVLNPATSETQAETSGSTSPSHDPTSGTSTTPPTEPAPTDPPLSSNEELAAQVGITQANLSILKTGKAKAIRFSTLDAICKALDCQPGDILEYREEESQ